MDGKGTSQSVAPLPGDGEGRRDVTPSPRRNPHRSRQDDDLGLWWDPNAKDAGMMHLRRNEKGVVV
jgi:hypothetical protein